MHKKTLSERRKSLSYLAAASKLRDFASKLRFFVSML